ncbi:MAG: LapA family protein [Prolixibacteraceae bacterium]|nr:LapA family protein [Prolixibacteraceae bacterium]
MQAILIILLILAVLLVIFTLQNSTEITVHLFLWEIGGVPLALVILCCVIIGYLISAVYFYPRFWKIKKENRRLLKLTEKLNETQRLNNQVKNKIEDPEGLKMDDDENNDNHFFKD